MLRYVYTFYKIVLLYLKFFGWSVKEAIILYLNLAFLKEKICCIKATKEMGYF